MKHRPINEWERELIKREFDRAHNKEQRADIEGLSAYLKRSVDTVKHIAYLHGYTVSSGKVSMCDNQRDNAYMKKAKEEYDDEHKLFDD